MSGFLGRMIAGAAAPEMKLRPFAGSVFAQAQAERQPMEEFAETVTEPAAAYAPRRQQQQLEVPEHEPQSVATKFSIAATPEMRTQAVMPESRTQLVAKLAADVAVPRAQAREEHRTDEASPARGNLREEIYQPSVTQEKTSAVPQVHELLVPASLRPQTEVGALLMRPRRSDAAAAQSSKTLAQNPRDTRATANQPSQPPDIQVHIGRIEVVAVPPAAAPQTKARPRANSTSLQEYLRQTGGRR